MSNRDLRCIVRIDVDKPKKQHCWLVKIIRPGNSFHRSFSDSKFGGKKLALFAAKKCRDKELKKRPAMSSYEQAIRLKKTNTSGIVGVRRTKRIVGRGANARSYDVWAATGTPVTGGRTTTRYFSIASMGVKKAKAAAIAQRLEWQESLRKSIQQKKKSS